MLLSKEVETIVTASTLKRYIELGYEIPQKVSKNNSQKMVYALPSKIKIKVEDLPCYSETVVDVLCDYCKENICHPTYANYNKVMNNTGGTYACLNCSSIKKQENNLKKYNVRFTAQLSEVKEKIMNTNLQKIGYTCALANPEKRKQSKITMKNKYGVEHPMQSSEIRQKAYNTNTLRYGVEHPAQNKHIREKVEQTCFDRFGDIHPSRTKNVRKKVQQTCFKKWGVGSYTSTKEFREKTVISFFLHNSQKVSKQQNYINNLYNGILNFPCEKYNLDIVVNNFDIEFDGSGHCLSVRNKVISEQEFKRKELIRDKIVKEKGYKIIRIISRKDKLPSDAILLDMFSYAKQYFLTNPQRSWITFDIDNSCIYNAYHKESTKGIPYDYGTLRKIKKINNN